VDYAAPTGTPIKATGDGRVLLAGIKGGYGRTVILKHGGSRSTLYAHMSSYSRNIRKGKQVKQGQIIGYVGKSGLATGPHLHYEFQVNGVHRNPLTIKLPTASGVPEKYLADFKKQTTSILTQLDGAQTTKFAELRKDETGDESIIALDDSVIATNSVH
jgi:murein DD-endopeptidase MepM/ murein hydrolase activator NlpD